MQKLKSFSIYSLYPFPYYFGFNSNFCIQKLIFSEEQVLREQNITVSVKVSSDSTAAADERGGAESTLHSQIAKTAHDAHITPQGLLQQFQSRDVLQMSRGRHVCMRYHITCSLQICISAVYGKGKMSAPVFLHGAKNNATLVFAPDR